MVCPEACRTGTSSRSSEPFVRTSRFEIRVAFAYVDGVAQQDRMKALGLFGGRAPARVAVNAKEEGVIAPYPESLPLDRSHLRDFLGAFLARRLRSKEDSDAFARTAQR